MSDIVIRWEDLRNKLVTARDKQVGLLVDTVDDSFIIQSTRRMKYCVPKSHVEQYNGYEVFLDISSAELGKYKQQV